VFPLPALLPISEGAGDEAAAGARFRFRDGALVVVVWGNVELPFEGVGWGVDDFEGGSVGGGEEPSVCMVERLL